MGTPAAERSPDISAVTISRDGEWYVAVDEATGVASQGESRSAALSNLADAIELHESGGEPIDDPDTFLREEFDIEVEQIDERDPPLVGVVPVASPSRILLSELATGWRWRSGVSAGVR